MVGNIKYIMKNSSNIDLRVTKRLDGYNVFHLAAKLNLIDVIRDSILFNECIFGECAI